MNNKARLQHAIRMKFGTSPNEPTDQQINSILLEASYSQKSYLTDAEWWEIVKKYVPSAGRYGYHGLDNSDINSLYAQLMTTIRRY